MPIPLGNFIKQVKHKPVVLGNYLHEPKNLPNNINSIIKNLESIYTNTLTKNYKNIYNKTKKSDYIIKLKKEVRKIIIRNNINPKYDLISSIRVSNSNLLDSYHINQEPEGKGGFSKIYVLYDTKFNDTKFNDTKLILKYIHSSKIEEQKIELKTYIFNILLQYYLQSNPNNLKYICEVKEFGKIKNNEFKNKEIKSSFYCIMDNCGKDLNNLCKNINLYYYSLNEKIINNQIKLLIKIFIECCNAVNVLHKLDYIHNDIKPDNFLFYIDRENKIQIKIIDFGGIKKEGNMPIYYSYTWGFCDPSIIGKNIKMSKSFDIFSLGMTFFCILLQYFNIDYMKYQIKFFYLLNNYTNENIFDQKKYIDTFSDNNKLDNFLGSFNYPNMNIFYKLINIINSMINRSPQSIKNKDINIIIEKLNSF